MRLRVLMLSAAVLPLFLSLPLFAADVVRYARFRAGDRIAYGIVEDEKIREITGSPFRDWQRTDRVYPLQDVRLLVPCRPTQVLAMAGNYRSHLADQAIKTTVTTTTVITTDRSSGESTVTTESETDTRHPGQVPTKFQIPQPFFKSPSCLIRHEARIVLPKDARSVHYEAEMVIVIGKRASKVSVADAADYVLGVTIGNDVSAREWQDGDVQWWRAKGSDTFGPCGPFIVSGLDYDHLQLQLRVNGEVKQNESTGQLIHNVAAIVSGISRHITLKPGDLIFSGTPGTTGPLNPGDVVEVSLEGVGVLRNRVVAERD